MIPRPLYDAIISVCCEHFGPATLDDSLLVVIPERNDVLLLKGWNDKLDGWEWKAADGSTGVSKKIADPWLARRLCTYMLTGRVTIRPGEIAPLFLPEELNALAEEVRVILQDKGLDTVNGMH